ncbi:MAG: (Fe-S)-binding protein [Deltaproteobacteria bacterium]|nr:(Fe-S)-binding protein [Deltaproteobacteria bacterium]
MSPVSATYWGIPGTIIFWVLFAIAFGVFLRRSYFLYRRLRLGKPERRSDRIGQRAIFMLSVVSSQWCALKTVGFTDLAGLGHALMFWGFGFFLIGYVIIFGVSGGLGLSLPPAFEALYRSILDIAALCVIAAVIVAVIKRYIVKPKRLEREESLKEKMIMALLFTAMIVLMALHYGTEGLKYAAYNISPSPIIGGLLANSLTSAGLSPATLSATYTAFWWLNYVILLGALIYAPHSAHLHPLFSPANIFFRPLGPTGALEPVPAEETENFGVSKLQDFTWKQLLDLYACTWCGRCHAACPAQLSGKSLSPREIILNLKEHLLEEGPGLLNGKAEGSSKLIGDVVTEDALWACTTCGACVEACAVKVEHVRRIMDLRRNLVLTQNKMPETAQLMLRNMQSRGHPWAGIQSLRLRGDWTDGLDVKVLADGDTADTLFWVGCTGALVERNVKATISMTRVLKTAGVDFAVLGEAETCCGDPARRAGYEFQFQMMAEQNIETFKSHNIKEIVTSCPHCYNTLKNEYPQYGGDFKVVHYTQFIGKLIAQGKLKLANGLNSKITYHDPCYLGRYNGVYQEPRQVLQSIPQTNLVEMARTRNKAFCCGGGGGHMWIEEQSGTTKINQMRLDDALKTGAEQVVTACPYCLQMFEEGIEHKGIKGALKVQDLAEIVEAAMQPSESKGAA